MKRDLKIDGLKGVMIFLVVLAHVGNLKVPFIANHIIYSFHMPIFIFVSGYLTTSYTGGGKQLLKWSLTTLAIYAVAQEVQCLLTYIMDRSFDLKRILLIQPYFALWYLVSLVTWRILFAGIGKRIGDIQLLILSFIICLLSGFFPYGKLFAIQRTLAFMPFFTIGYLCRKNTLMPIISKMPYGIAFLFLAVGAYISLRLPIYIPNEPYSGTVDIAIRMLQTANALTLTAAIVRLSRVNAIEKAAFAGRASLWIYIGHTYLILIETYVVISSNIRLNYIMALILAICYYSICILAYSAFQKLHKRKIRFESYGH